VVAWLRGPTHKRKLNFPDERPAPPSIELLARLKALGMAPDESGATEDSAEDAHTGTGDGIYMDVGLGFGADEVAAAATLAGDLSNASGRGAAAMNSPHRKRPTRHRGISWHM
jgi:hypothetical protein